MSTKNKPWLGDDGKTLTDEQLKIVSKSWGDETWHQYLKTIDVSERRDTTCVSEDYFDSICSDDATSVVFNLASKDEYPHLKAALYSCVMSLPTTQKEIVSLYYWKGMTIPQIARLRGASKQAVSKSLKRAIKNLHSYMVNGEFKKRVLFSQTVAAS